MLSVRASPPSTARPCVQCGTVCARRLFWAVLFPLMSSPKPPKFSGRAAAASDATNPRMKRIATRRAKPGQTAAHFKSLANLKKFKGYQPPKEEFSLAELLEVSKEVKESREAEAAAEHFLQCARTRAVAAEWALHEKMLGAKRQVVALYGDDSDEVQAMGLKKKSEYKRPTGRKRKPGSLSKAA